MIGTTVAPRTVADDHSTRLPFPEVTTRPPGSAASTTDQTIQAPDLALGRTPLQVCRHHRHDWTDWQPILDAGVEEQLHERFCPTCGLDEIGVDERMGEWSSWPPPR